MASIQKEFCGMPASRPPRRGSKAWRVQEWNRFQELAKKHEGLTTPFFAQIGLGLSKQRVYELLQNGRLPSYDVMGKTLIPVDELLTFAAADRPTGRPKLAVA